MCSEVRTQRGFLPRSLGLPGPRAGALGSDHLGLEARTCLTLDNLLSFFVFCVLTWSPHPPANMVRNVKCCLGNP